MLPLGAEPPWPLAGDGVVVGHGPHAHASLLEHGRVARACGHALRLLCNEARP